VGDAKTDVTDALCVVVEDEDRRVALMVDELLGQQQVVIKSLGASLRNMQGLSGGAIMPDGTVGLIVDVTGLVRLADGGVVADTGSTAQTEEVERMAAEAARGENA
jgi:two-component system chemotaxis sensor kinase CheA